MRTPVLCVALGLAWATAAHADDRLRRNHEVVFDTSGSMEGSKLEGAKRALSLFLTTVPADTNVGLIDFHEGAPERVLPLAPAGGGRLAQVVPGLTASGATPIADSIALAARSLQEQQHKQAGYGTYTVLVVTDGEETVNEDGLPGIVESTLAAGIQIDVIGFDLGSDHSLKSQVTRYRSADDEAGLTHAILDTLAETESYDEASHFGADSEARPRKRKKDAPERARPVTAAFVTLCEILSFTVVAGLAVGVLVVRSKARSARRRW